MPSPNPLAMLATGLLACACLTTGCVLQLRALGGAGVAPQAAGTGLRGAAPIGLGYAMGMTGEQVSVLASNSVLLSPAEEGRMLAMGGIEVDYDLHNRASGVRPQGLRGRVEAGVSTVWGPSRTAGGSAFSGTENNSLVLAVVPGYWWMLAGSRVRPHRLVVALEPRIGADIPTDGNDRSVGFLATLSLSVEWHWAWLPCTIFGGPSCRGGEGTAPGSRGWAAPPDPPAP